MRLGEELRKRVSGPESVERDLLVLSAAMFCFSLGFQMVSRYVPRYMSVLGAGSVAIGAYTTASNLLSAFYPYPGGVFSDRFGSRTALTLFGAASTTGFAVWLLAPHVGDLLGVPAWSLIFVGLVLAQAWKSLGLGATFALVKQSTDEGLATGFAATETFRRVAFLVGPLVAAALLAVEADFVTGFGYILGVAVAFGVVGTVAQHVLYDRDADVGKEMEELSRVLGSLRRLPDEIRPLLVGDTLVRFANGMVYAFFVIVVTELLPKQGRMAVSLPVAGTIGPDALFGVLLGVEMAVALGVMLPSARIADTYGLKPVVATGFAVYAVFPVLLIYAPADPLVVGVVFAFSGLRFAGLPAHKALIVGPAEEKAGGKVTGAYYLLRNLVVIPSGVVGGWLYGVSPTLAFVSASGVGVAGTAYFAVFGKGFG